MDEVLIEGYIQLAGAIVLRAIKDYKLAKHKNDKTKMNSIKNFLIESTLTLNYGNYIVDKIDEI